MINNSFATLWTSYQYAQFHMADQAGSCYMFGHPLYRMHACRLERMVDLLTLEQFRLVDPGFLPTSGDNTDATAFEQEFFRLSEEKYLAGRKNYVHAGTAIDSGYWSNMRNFGFCFPATHLSWLFCPSSLQCDQEVKVVTVNEAEFRSHWNGQDTYRGFRSLVELLVDENVDSEQTQNLRSRPELKYPLVHCPGLLVFHHVMMRLPPCDGDIPKCLDRTPDTFRPSHQSRDWRSQGTWTIDDSEDDFTKFDEPTVTAGAWDKRFTSLVGREGWDPDFYREGIKFSSMQLVRCCVSKFHLRMLQNCFLLQR